MPDYTEFKGITHIGQDSYGEILRANILSFIEWGFLNTGGFINVNIPSSGLYGGNKHKLQPARDPRYTDGQVWQSFRNNWVWQSGLSTQTQPIQVSGVYVNSSFYPLSTTGTYAHYVDYPRGRIVFNTPISTGSVVTAEYSYKWIQTVDARDSQLVKSIQYNANRVDNSHFTQFASGDWNPVSETRVALPLIAVHTSEKTTYRPYQIGGGSYVHKNIVCYIFSENDRFHGKIADILSSQKEKTIRLYDTNKIAEASRFPLNNNGSIASGALTYPQMVLSSGEGGFYYDTNCTGTLRFVEAESMNGMWLTQNLYYSIVKFQTESILTNI